MQLSLAQAAQAVGRSRSTVLRAIQTGRLSAARDEDDGTWSIDASELHRVYPVDARHADAPDGRNDFRNDVIKAKDDLISEQRAMIDDLRRRLDSETEERRRLTLMLADQRQASAPAPAPAAPALAESLSARRWRLPWSRRAKHA